MENKTLKVDGMSCNHCVNAVNNALGSLAGVANVAVSLKEGAVSFDFDPALGSIEAIKAAITEEGFEVVG